MEPKYYCINLRLFEGKEITIGKKGREYFPPGFYFYVGKAKKGIRKRVARHILPEKKKRWHIDFLSEKAFPVAVKFYEEEGNSECSLAGELAERGGRIIMEGFGSTDCQCPSHLFFFPNPHKLPGEK